MTNTIMIIPATLNVAIKETAKNLEKVLTKSNFLVSLLPEFDRKTIEQFLVPNRLADLLLYIVKQREQITIKHDVVLVQGVSLTKPYATELNFSIATALGAAVIFIATLEKNQEETLRQLKIIINPYQYRYPKTILGLLTNDNQEIKFVEKHKNTLELNLLLMGTTNNIADISSIQQLLKIPPPQQVTPSMFKYHLIEKAISGKKTILLPEGSEPRTIQAANICTEQNIAQCILLEDKNKISASCEKLNLKLHQKIKIIEPQTIAEKYVTPLYEIRRAKGLTIDAARKQLEDNVVLGTMMLQLGEVDGLVSGAIHTSADTIRPAFQIIKTHSNVKLVSSILFMCLPDQVLLYGDCAINPNPTAEELADIAIQSAASAVTFGITPRIAMLSYSTGYSGSGPDVDRVRAATEIVKKLRPDLEIEGPIQYDAAISEETARIKKLQSKVAGHATVFIMPNLDVGNIMYKAVQRSTGIICIGPMLQGLRKPVNDLSRGCSVDDIVYTIALTAVQAINNTNNIK